MTKSIIAVLFGWTALLFGGCSEQSAPAPATPEGRIIAALHEVLGRNDAPFAIIEHSASGGFVQFAGSRRDPLLLELLDHGLSQEQRSRAEELFASRGGSYVDGGPDMPGGSFQLDFGRNAEEAARFALRIFRDVYQLPEDAELTATVDS